MNKDKAFSKIWFLGVLLIALVAGCAGNGPESVSLVSVEVTPAGSTIAKDTTKQFTATGFYSDNSTKDLTSSATWSSSDRTIATINAAGLATGAGVGSPTITAVSGNVTGTTSLKVTSATLVSINVTPTNSVMAKSTTRQFTATGLFSDGTNQDLTNQATWSSSTESFATVSDAFGSKGLATSVEAGPTNIKATIGTTSGENALTVTNATLVSISVTSSNPSMAKGTTKQFTATGTFSDNSVQEVTDQASWSSSTASVATIGDTAASKGLARSAATGSTVITATVATVSGTQTLTVTDATLASIAVTTTNSSIAKGWTSQFTATGTFSDKTTQDITSTVTWNSSKVNVATISNAAKSNGLATSAATGSTTITANAGAVSGTSTLTVTNVTLKSIAVATTTSSIAKGRTSQFTATGTFTDNSTQVITSTVSWSSLSDTVTTISNAAGSYGLAKSIGTGTATIKATLGDVSGTSTLEVTAAALESVSVTPTNKSIALGATLQLTAAGVSSDNQPLVTPVSWSSSNEAVATVDSTGLAKGLKLGTTTITALDPVSKKTGTTMLTVVLKTVDLGTAGNFVILAKSGVSTTGTTKVVGNIGLSPAAASFITGFGLIADSTNNFSTSSLVTGKIYASNYAPPTPVNMTTAVSDMETAFTDAAGRTLPDHTELGAGNISGMTLAPGLYKWGTGVLITSAGVTLSGSANDVWIFQIGQDLTVSNSAIITLSGGALAKNIFWQVDGQATLGTAADFKGIILTKKLISLNTGAKMSGRALAQTAVTLDATSITAP